MFEKLGTILRPAVKVIDLIQYKDRTDGLEIKIWSGTNPTSFKVSHEDFMSWLDAEGYLSGTHSTHKIEAGDYKEDEEKWEIGYVDFINWNLPAEVEILYKYLKAKKLTTLKYDPA